MTTYELRIGDALGNTKAIVRDFTTDPDKGGAMCSYALNVGQVGVLVATLPPQYDDLLVLDGRVSVFRDVGGGLKRDGDAQYLIRRWDYGEQTTTITALHVNSLLRRRILAYYAGTTFTKKGAAAADNLIKQFVGQQMGTTVDTGNRLSPSVYTDISAYVAATAQTGQAQSTTMAAAWQNLFDVVRKLCDASTQAGTYLTAEIIATSDTELELRTYVGQRGVDRRSSSNAPLIFSSLRGNVANVVLSVDRQNEVNWAAGAGVGEGTARMTQTAYDLARLGESPLNRHELFVDQSNVSDTNVLLTYANAAVRAGRPAINLSGDVVETPFCIRGLHYDLGDYVTVEHRGQQYDVRLDTVAVQLGKGQVSQKVEFRYNP